MLFGIGHDIVNIKRIEVLLAKYGERLIQKILSPLEQELITKVTYPAMFISKRFAAKEAFAKACGTGLRSPIQLQHISIINDNLGKPDLDFSPQIKTWLSNRGITSCYLSLSDEIITEQISLASAYVILEQSK